MECGYLYRQNVAEPGPVVVSPLRWRLLAQDCRNCLNPVLVTVRTLIAKCQYECPDLVIEDLILEHCSLSDYGRSLCLHTLFEQLPE